jgi:hypothetical protein
MRICVAVKVGDKGGGASERREILCIDSESRTDL